MFAGFWEFIMSRLRICHLITELAPAGAERALYELVVRLDRARFDVQVVSLRGGAVVDWLVRQGIRTTVLGVRGKWDVLKLFRLVKLLRAERIDILHTHLFHADLAGRVGAYLAGTRCVIHTVQTAEGRFRPWQFAWARLTADMCKRIVIVSPSARDHHARRSGLANRRYTVIPNAIDPSAYSRDQDARRRLRKQWGIADEEILVVFVGRLSEEKGLETLLGAMRELSDCENAPKLVIAGDGPKRPMVEQFIASEPAGKRIRLLGFTNDVRGVLSAADIFAIPSRWEGLSLAAVEAMAASLPVIASRVPGLRDVVVPGQTGLLIDKGDAAAMGGAIARLSYDAGLRDRLGLAGLDRVTKHFNIRSTVAAHEKLYTELSHPKPKQL